MKALPIFALLTLSLAPLHAQQAWTGAVDSAWGTAGNWSPSGIPSSGVLTFGAASGYTVNLGGVARSLGGLVLNSSSAYSFASGGASGSLQFATATGITQSGSGAVDFANNISFLGSSNRNIGGNGTGTMTFSGVLSRSSGQLLFDGAFETVFAGAAVNTLGSGAIVIGGASAGNHSTVTLSRTTTAAQNAVLGTGLVTLSNGTLKITDTDLTLANDLRVGSGDGIIQTGRLFTLNGALRVNGSRTLTWSNTQKAIVNGDVTTENSGSAGTRIFTFAGTGDVDFNGDIVQPETETGRVVAINKTGSGVFRFNGDSAYTGSTSVSAGSLLINGTGGGQGSYSITGSGTLGGLGTVGLATTATLSLNSATARLAPGDGSIGTLTIDGGGTNATAGLLLNAGELVFDITGLSSDTIVLTNFAVGAGQGSSTAGVGGLSVTFNGTAGSVATYELIRFASAPGIAVDRFALSAEALAAGWVGSFAYQGNSLVFEAVPEPGSWALLVGAAGLWGIYRRRR